MEGRTSHHVRRRACPAAARADHSLVCAARSGDETAATAIVERYGGLVRGRARAYYLAGADRDDVVQEAMLGLCKAIRDFDVDRGTDFGIFADVCVRRQLVSALRTSRRHKHAPLAAYRSLEDGGVSASPVPTGPSMDPAEHVVESFTAAEAIAAAARVMTRLERTVVCAHAFGQSYTLIAARLGRDTKCIDNALQRARRKVARQLVSRTGS